MIPELERLGQKRRSHPITICGETIYIRAFKKAERKEFEPLMDQPESYGFVLGNGLVTEDGKRVFDRVEGEDVKAFADRVEEELDLPDDTRSQIATAIVNLSKEVTAAQLRALKKN